jgi:hypothetical protein
MDGARRTRTGLAVASVALGTGLLACGSGSLEGAREDALGYFAHHVEEADTSWSYLPPYFARRFGVEVRLASGLLLTPEGLRALGDDLPTLEVFRRLFRRSAPIAAEDVAALESPVDRMLAVALHCRELGLPEDWLTVLRSASELGGYALTHAVLAGQWSVENGCLPWLERAPLLARQVEGLVEILAAQDELGGDDPRAADVWLEGLALLHYVGAGDRMAPAWLETLQSLQRGDGGWPEHRRSAHSSPHATAFALWVLLERLQPDAPNIPMAPPARGP